MTGEQWGCVVADRMSPDEIHLRPPVSPVWLASNGRTRAAGVYAVLLATVIYLITLAQLG